MFTPEPLSAELYRKFIDIKYSANADITRGWALRDKHDQTHAWHPREPGTAQWSDAESAYRAFVPDTQRRHLMSQCGWYVSPTVGLSDLTAILAAARGTTDQAHGNPT